MAPPDPVTLWPGFSYKPHQRKGIHWMLEREAAVPSGGLLCDEMGLGKTIQMIGLMKTAVRSTSVLLAPVAVLEQWADTARRAGLIVLRPKIGKGVATWVIEGPFRPGASRLHLIGYESARAHPTLVTDMAWDRLICDEAHRIAAPQLGKLVALVIAPRRWFLTGTPIVNGIEDVAHLLDQVGVDGVQQASKDFAALEPILKTHVLARSMDELRASIPDAPPRPVLHTRTLPFATEAEAEFYRGMSGVIVKRWKALDTDGGAGAALMKLKLFMRLRQLSLHPQVYIKARREQLGDLYERPDWVGSSTKFDAILGQIRSELGSGTPKRWIVFCHFHAEMDMLKVALEAQPFIRNVQLYNGTLSASERKAVLASSLEPLETNRMADVLLVQLQSGGVGLNLQHYNRILFTGPWWTAALMEQAIGRAVRIGQTEVVRVYHLRLEEEDALNIDQFMMEKAATKGELCERVLAAACRVH